MKQSGLSSHVKMASCVLLTALLVLPFAVGWVVLGEREEAQTVCAGREFRLPVYSTSRTVTFTPYPEGPRSVLLDKTIVKDRRFEWTRDKMLVLREVTHGDQGLYAIKLSLTGFTYETLRLTVSECIQYYHRNYGEKFEHIIPDDGFLLEFSPRGAPPEAMPVVLWNRTDPETSDAGRGRLLRGGKFWVAERVTQADQGNYTVIDSVGKVLSRSTLTVSGHSFNVTRFIKESLNLPLFLPVPHAHLIFTPTRYPDHSSLGFEPKSSRGPAQLIREGHITDRDLRYRGLISVGRNGTINVVIIESLTLRHTGVYEIRDGDGNLVSSTWLQVIEKSGRWRSLLKSITVPSGMFLSLAAFVLFMRRYPYCSLSQIIAGLRANRTPPADPPRVNIQDYSQPSPQRSDYYSHSQHPGTPRGKLTPRASPTHTGYSPVTVGTHRAENQEANTSATWSSPCHNPTTERDTSHNNEEERRISFSVPGASDCLHSSEDCVQFLIKKDGDKKRLSKSQGYFATLPLDTDASESCSVYTSEKLNF